MSASQPRRNPSSKPYEWNDTMNRLIAFSMIVTSLFVLSACDSGIEVTFELDGETYESEVLK